MQIIGLDSEDIGDAETSKQDQLVRKHVEAIIDHFGNSDFEIISLIEINLSGQVANHIGQIMDEFHGVYHAKKDEKENAIGIYTEPDGKRNGKEAMVNTLRSLIQNNNITICKDIICAGRRKGLSGHKKSASVTLLLSEQLKRLQQRIKHTRDNFGRLKSQITGKMANYQDDLAIVTLITAHWATKYRLEGSLPLARCAPG